MHVPSREQAEKYLVEGEERNQGGWAAHSRNAAKAAEAIASQLSHLDAESAYVMGLLHDIGRRAGEMKLYHIWVGYQFMLTEGYPDMARICLTHSFLFKDARRAQYHWDGSEEVLNTIETYLSGIEYDDYDRLIQLCDAVSVSSGYWLIEKRLLDVGIRHGVYEAVPQRWQKMLDLRQYFDELLGRSVYTLLPGVVENTFGVDLCSEQT